MNVKSIILSDLQTLLLGIFVAAAITVSFFGGIFVLFALAIAGSHDTMSASVSPDGTLVATVEEFHGGAMASDAENVYVQLRRKFLFDQKVLVGTLQSATVNDRQSGVIISWLSPTDLQITYLDCRYWKIATTARINGRTLRIHRNAGVNTPPQTTPNTKPSKN